MIPGGGLNLFLGFLPHLSSTPRGGLGTFWRRICTAPSAFRPPRLLCGRAASYGSIIVWKYQEAAYSPFKVHQLRACPPLWGEALAVTIVYLKIKNFFRKWYFRFCSFFHRKNRKWHFRFFVNTSIILRC